LLIYCINLLRATSYEYYLNVYKLFFFLRIMCLQRLLVIEVTKKNIVLKSSHIKRAKAREIERKIKLVD